jgi:uncharacterized protein (TIGR02246 family)
VGSDEDAIRKLVDTWMSATKAGDVETVLDLMTDDALFLIAGRPPMRKDEFAAAAKAQASGSAPRFDGTSDVQEIKVVGDWAFMWSKLDVIATPPDGSPAIERTGYTLTILKKEHGRWRLARDANLLSPVERSQR